jgi:hypothetical protein
MRFQKMTRRYAEQGSAHSLQQTWLRPAPFVPPSRARSQLALQLQPSPTNG